MKNGKQEKQLEIAKKLLNIGMHVKEISKITELTIEEIEELNRNKLT